jgi:membrane protease YdiL (CAAX protease family)
MFPEPLSEPDPTIPLPADAEIAPEPPRPRGHAGMAWAVIIGVTVAVIWFQRDRAEKAAAGGQSDLVVMQLQAKFLVGFRDLLRITQPAGASQDVQASLLRDAEQLNHGPPGHRLRFVILIGELAGPDAALERLEELHNRLTDFTEADLRIMLLLDKLYHELSQGGSATDAVADSDRAYLREHLGWFGQLAVADADSKERSALLADALQTVVILVVALLVALAVGFAGLIGLVILVTGLSYGKVARLATPSGHGGVYAETFAWWMVLYVGMNLGLAYLPAPTLRLPLSGVAMLASAAMALVWPVWRGIPWAQVRDDIGLKLGSTPLLEPVLGVWTYAMALPLMCVGVLLTLLLLRLQAALHGRGGDIVAADTPTHPIFQFLLEPNWLQRFGILVLAAVVAPLVEETMFRGVLYRHLRDAGARLPWLYSFLLAATIGSFVFAAVHPQGLATIPALMSLAYAFTLAREWRGTLIPSMVAHGINNGLVLTLVIYMLG